MKTPAFWQNRTLLTYLLLPFAALYQLGYLLRRLLVRPTPLPIPVICIGNLVAGGAGKTPVALAIGAWAKQHDIHACFFSKGYGGSAREPMLVDPYFHPHSQVGDEPLLLARILPTVVAKDRLEGAKFAAQQGFRLIIMDDGFQNPNIKPDLSLVVVDSAYGFGNGYTLPSGPLREPAPLGLARADAVVLLSRDGQEQEAKFDLPAGLPLLPAQIRTVCVTPLAGQPVLAFSGIARPEQFFDSVQNVLNAQLVATRTFPDHHAFTPTQLAALAQEAMLQNAALITTAKDSVRLPRTMQSQVFVADIALNWQNASAIEGILSRFHTLKSPEVKSLTP